MTLFVTVIDGIDCIRFLSSCILVFYWCMSVYIVVWHCCSIKESFDWFWFA